MTTEQRLAEIEARIDAIAQQLTPLSLSRYPAGWLMPSEAIGYTAFDSMEALTAACQSNFFRPRTELLSLNPEGSSTHAFLINIKAFQQRIQTAVISAAA